MVELKFKLLANDVELLEGHKKKWLKYKCCPGDINSMKSLAQPRW